MQRHTSETANELGLETRDSFVPEQAYYNAIFTNFDAFMAHAGWVFHEPRCQPVSFVEEWLKASFLSLRAVGPTCNKDQLREGFRMRSGIRTEYGIRAPTMLYVE